MAGIDRHRANDILAHIPRRRMAALAPHFELVQLAPHSILAEPDKRPPYAYFPHSGAVSLMAALPHKTAETAIIGREGFFGFGPLLGVHKWNQHAVVQIAGPASRIPIRELSRATEKDPALEALLLSYVGYLIVQVLHSAACNCLHTVNQRCARWLLMAHDRVESDRFYITHTRLAQVLGTRRASITIAARRLQKLGLIRYSRGLITICDRRGLEQASCRCYGLVRKAHDEMLSRRRKFRVGNRRTHV